METYECRGCGYVMSSNEKVCKYCGSPNPIYSGSLKSTLVRKAAKVKI